MLVEVKHLCKFYTQKATYRTKMISKFRTKVFSTLWRRFVTDERLFQTKTEMKFPTKVLRPRTWWFATTHSVTKKKTERTHQDDLSMVCTSRRRLDYKRRMTHRAAKTTLVSMQVHSAAELDRLYLTFRYSFVVV